MIARRNAINHGNAVATKIRYTSSFINILGQLPRTKEKASDGGEDSLPRISIVVSELGAMVLVGWLVVVLSIYYLSNEASYRMYLPARQDLKFGLRGASEGNISPSRQKFNSDINQGGRNFIFSPSYTSYYYHFLFISSYLPTSPVLLLLSGPDTYSTHHPLSVSITAWMVDDVDAVAILLPFPLMGPWFIRTAGKDGGGAAIHHVCRYRLFPSRGRESEYLEVEKKERNQRRKKKVWGLLFVFPVRHSVPRNFISFFRHFPSLSQFVWEG